MRSRVFGGAALVLKNSPSFLPFSSVSGGYQEISAGSPSKKSTNQNQCSSCLTLIKYTRHEHLILLFLVAGCKNVSTLKCLWEETKDIVDDE